MILPDDFIDLVRSNKLRLLKQKEVIDIQLISSVDSGEEKLNFDWKVTGFDESGFDIKLMFDNPLEVS